MGLNGFDSPELKVAFLTVNVANTDIPPGPLESFAQQTCISEAIFHYFSITTETQADQVIILANDLHSRTREVQGEGLLGATEVVQLEDEVFRQIRTITPNGPSKPCINQAKFMS